ncbi:MAG: hypothetical protein Q9166_001116 [cf. Caloplaca sp. 2 TL-2023]
MRSGRKAWDRKADGRCMSLDVVENVLIAQGVFSFLTDFVCAAFPALLLWNVKIRTKTKVGVCLLMGAGIITGGIAIARTAFAWQIKSNDVSWVGVPGALTRVFEVNIGIIAACSPVLRPFVRYIKARITGHSIRAGTQGSGLLGLDGGSRCAGGGGKGQNLRMGYMRKGGGDIDDSGDTDITISLPIQGIQERTQSMGYRRRS